MEYTADNYGYAFRPAGAARAIGVLSAGKYLLRRVDFNGIADRAATETGFFVWLANMLASHPVNTWRAAALRNRAVAGSLFFRPKPLTPAPAIGPDHGSLDALITTRGTALACAVAHRLASRHLNCSNTTRRALSQHVKSRRKGRALAGQHLPSHQ